MTFDLQTWNVASCEKLEAQAMVLPLCPEQLAGPLVADPLDQPVTGSISLHSLWSHRSEVGGQWPSCSPLVASLGGAVVLSNLVSSQLSQ